MAAVEGVSPSARNLADMGIRAAPSTEPWIESNVWLVRSFRLSSAWRPVWIGYQPDGGTAATMRDPWRTRRWREDAGSWRSTTVCARNCAGTMPPRWLSGSSIGACLEFAEQHADWRRFVPYGNLGIDPGHRRRGPRHGGRVPEAGGAPPGALSRDRAIRAESTASLAGLRAVLATELAPPTDGERKVLAAFAESGGWWWPDPPGAILRKTQPFAEIPLGKGRVAVYQGSRSRNDRPRHEGTASLKEAGMVAFNVPSVITYAQQADGKRMLVQLLNYSNSPATAITIRVNGTFKTARLFAPDAEPANLDHECGRSAKPI